MGELLAMILAGGRGKRMDILCQMRPKPALPFAGKCRVIDFTLSNCLNSRITDIAVLTDHQRSSMDDYLKRWQRSNMASGGLHILEPRKGSYRGTADAVYQNLGFLRGYEAVLVLAGDHVYKMDYRDMFAFHRKSHADVTIGAVRVTLEQTNRFGIISKYSDGRITTFSEKPDMPQSNLASMGIYIFNPELLAQRLTEDAARLDSTHDFGYAVIPEMVRRDRVFAYEFDSYWQDIGTTEAYYEANMELVKPGTSLSLDGRWPVFSEEGGTAPPRKGGQGTAVNSLVSPGCVIKGRVVNSILSPGVMVDSEAVVLDSVLMANVFVGYHSVVDRCVVGHGVSIGGFCYVGFGESVSSEGNGVTLLGEGVAVPDHTAIGRRCKVMPHTGHDDFTSSVVPSGTIISPLSRGGMPVEEKIKVY